MEKQAETFMKSGSSCNHVGAIPNEATVPELNSTAWRRTPDLPTHYSIPRSPYFTLRILYIDDPFQL